MTFKRKVLAVIMITGVLLSVFAMQSGALTSLDYTAKTHKKLGYDTNHYPTAKPLHVNNTYKSGTCGVYLSVENYGGTSEYGKKLFPKGTSVSDLVVSVPAGATRYFWVKSQLTSNTVRGSYDYEFSLYS